MRIPHLVGLVGLVGLASLAFAAPAPPDSVPRNTVDNANISALAAAGDTVVCQNTLDNGPCELHHAQNRCVTLGPGLSHKVQTIYQAAGSVCKYFESDCSARYPVVSVNSRSKPIFLQLGKNVGGKIGLVLCKDSWSSAEINGGLTPVDPRHVEATSSYPTIPFLGDKGDAASIDVRRSEAPGDTRICDDANFQWCRDNVNAMDRCSSLDPAAGGPSSLIQFRGAFCKWYRGFGCSRESNDHAPMKIDSRAQKVELGELGPNNNLFKSVECRGASF
ncbi:uncharacterized protein K460DRAFT_353399 [Cucurbitaria berberidis CBS 394.84]|uniref:Uncharacterized protein n=1 Tax=Cucurbitaria berberidis CBS 394.84 TaxID=1168544 RepID=A0A9P4LAV6_9PLEO|nr:uncharacterized protein K460DRAFT_353399 [Cucurbitaria berberidis CBS 394.84]KAF1848420.1 hypothetical protein K460DRAFT_353399 [Cucurbitaria berberidis CBS 394.84]